MKIEKCFLAKWPLNIMSLNRDCTVLNTQNICRGTKPLNFHGLNRWFFDHLFSFLFDNTQFKLSIII